MPAMSTKALVVTSSSPPVLHRDVEGYYRRLRLFMRAIGSLSDRVDMLHIVPQSVIAANPDADELNVLQSQYWGFPVHVRVIARRDRDETFFNHYLRGIFSAAEQPLFYASAGRKQAEAIAGALNQPYDLIFVHRLEAMCALLRSGISGGNIAFDLDDLAHSVHIRASFQLPIQPGKLLLLSHAPALLLAERRADACSQRLFVCSEIDRRKLRRLGFSRGVTVVPNAVPFPQQRPDVTDETSLLYIGDAGYGPNREAMERLALRILPRVRDSVPAARLLLVGRRSELLSRAALSQPGVECLGFVESLDELYAQVRVVCCPLRKGGGTRVKLIEAATYAKPMVATRIGAEGLEFVDGSEIMLRDDDAGFASACVALLNDRDLCRRLGDAAWNRARQTYDAGKVEAQIARILREVIRNNTRSSVPSPSGRRSG